MQDKLNIVWGYSLVAKSIIRSYKLNIDGPWVRFSVSPFIFAFFLLFSNFCSNLALLRSQGRACAPSPSNHSAFTSPFDTPDPSHSSLEALVMSSYPLHQSPPASTCIRPSFSPSVSGPDLPFIIHFRRQPQEPRICCGETLAVTVNMELQPYRVIEILTSMID